MRQRNPRSVFPVTDFFEYMSSDIPSCLFERQLLFFRISSDIFMKSQKFNIQLLTKGSDVILICIRTFSAKSVMNMHYRQPKPHFLLKFYKHEKKAYGVCTSRYACNYMIFFLQHMVFFHICPHPFIHSGLPFYLICFHIFSKYITLLFVSIS